MIADIFSLPKPLPPAVKRSLSPGTIFVWMIAGVLSRVFTRSKTGSLTGVLAKGDLLCRGDFVVFDYLAQHAFGDRLILDFERGFQLSHYILSDEIVAIHKQFFDNGGDLRRIDLPYVHIFVPFGLLQHKFYIFYYKTFLQVFQYFLFCDTIKYILYYGKRI